MKGLFPDGTETAVKLNKLYRTDKKERRFLSEFMSTRMVKCASVLDGNEYVGWQLIVPQKGLARMFAFGTGAVSVGGKVNLPPPWSTLKRLNENSDRNRQ